MSKSSSLPQSLDSLRSEFKVMKECPLCGNAFKVDSIKIIDQKHGSHTLHITCSKCKNSIILFIGITDVGIGLVGLTIDLTFEDAHRLKNKQSITENDLLNYYKIINNKSNSFVQLLTKK